MPDTLQDTPAEQCLQMLLRFTEQNYDEIHALSSLWPTFMRVGFIIYAHAQGGIALRFHLERDILSKFCLMMPR